MADLAALQVQLELQSAQFTQGMQDVNSQLDKLNKSVASSSALITKFGVALVAAVASSAVTGAFRQVIDGMDEMSKAAQKVGTSVESLSALAFAADMSGVSFETLQTSLGKLSQNLQDVENQTSNAGKALAALGVSGGDTADQALAKIADGFAAVPDSAKKTALALELFGKAGKELIPLLNEGASGIDELKNRAAELGIVLDGDTTKKAEDFNDALSEIQAAGKGVLTQITIGMLPALQDLARSFANMLSTSNQWQDFGQVIGGAFKGIVSAGIAVIGVFKAIGTYLGMVLAVNQQVFSGDFAGAWQTFKDGWSDVGSVAKDTSKAITDMWKAVTPPEEVTKDQEQVTKNANAMAKAFGVLGGEAKKVKKVKEELDPLTKAFKELIDLSEKRQASGAILSVLADENTITWLMSLGVSFDEIADKMEQLRAIADPAAEAQRKLNEQLKEQGKALTLQVDPMAAYNERLNELAKLLDAGAISFEVYDKAAAQAADTMNSAYGPAVDAAAEKSTALETAMGNLVSSGIEQLSDALLGNADSWQDWAAGLAKSIAKALLNIALLELALRALEAVYPGSSKLLGLAPRTASVQSPAPPATGLQASTASATSSTTTSSAAIIPFASLSRGSAAAPVAVTVNNYAPSTDVDVAENQKADGTREITLTIRREMRSAFADGSMDQSMRGNFGVNRKAVA